MDTDRPAKPVAKPDDTPAKPDEVVPPVKPDDKAPEAPIKPVKAAELRVAYDNLKKEKREVLEPKIQSLESKIKELESRQPEDTKPIIEKMSAIEKRNAELEQHIAFVDYQKSNEFRVQISAALHRSMDQGRLRLLPAYRARARRCGPGHRRTHLLHPARQRR